MCPTDILTNPHVLRAAVQLNRIFSFMFFLLDDDDVDLLGVWCEAGPDAGQAGQGGAGRLPDQEAAGVPGLGQVGEEGGAVEPQEVEPGQALLVPDERSVDVVNAAEQVDPAASHQLGDGGLGLGVPQHRTVNVMDDEVEVGAEVGQDLLDVFCCRGEVAL